MPDYAYKAASSTGEIIRGTQAAANVEELAAVIRSKGLHLLESSEKRGGRLLQSLREIDVGGISRRDLIEFSNNMGVMFKAGVPLIQSLNEIRQDVDRAHFKRVLGELVDNIQAGDSLSDAMNKRPKDFPTLYTNVVQIGENTGSLDSVFFDLSKHYKRIDDLIRNVRKAMMYPAFVLFALILAGFVFLTMVFPPLFSLLIDFGVPLPLVTKVVMAVSTTLQNDWGVILVIVVILVVGFILGRKKPETKYYLDWGELNFPAIRTLFIQLRLAFFMRYLSMLLMAGMDILRGLELATDSVNNLVIQKYLRIAREKVIEGEFLSDALRPVRYIPNMVTRMIAIGEEAGNLPEQMEYVADYYNEELERRIATALALLEPVLLFALAGLALALVMGVLLPLYGLVSTLSMNVGSGTGL